MADNQLPPQPSALAVAAHPDDIEFVMAGTLLLLAQRGYAIHYFNIANGCCGSMEMGRADTARARLMESQAAAAVMGAEFHPPICDDLAIFYDQPTLAKVSSVLRRVNPTILLTHSPIDYMEDHENAARLAVTAAFSKGMPNYRCEPPTPAAFGDIAVYHAQPHGNRTPFGDWVRPELVVDISSVVTHKTHLLACHKSQQQWLDATQKMSSYTSTMLELGKQVASMVGRDGYGEGWRQRSSLGFGPSHWDPLGDALGDLVQRDSE